MMITHDPNSLTNSVMMEIEKVFRRNGIADTTHRHYEGNRRVIKGLVEMMMMDISNDPPKGQDDE